MGGGAGSTKSLPGSAASRRSSPGSTDRRRKARERARRTPRAGPTGTNAAARRLRARKKAELRSNLNPVPSFEARSIYVPSLPQVPQFRAWQLAPRDEFDCASGSPDDGLQWVLELGKKSYNELGDSGMFPTLDSKLAAALSKVMGGELGRQINLKKEQVARKQQYLKGRQIWSMLHDHYRVSETDCPILKFHDLLNVEMKGGDLRAFLNEWRLTTVGMSPVPEDNMSETLFRTPEALGVEGACAILRAFADWPSGESLRLLEFSKGGARALPVSEWAMSRSKCDCYLCLNHGKCVRGT